MAFTKRQHQYLASLDRHQSLWISESPYSPGGLTSGEYRAKLWGLAKDRAHLEEMASLYSPFTSITWSASTPRKHQQIFATACRWARQKIWKEKSIMFILYRTEPLQKPKGFDEVKHAPFNGVSEIRPWLDLVMGNLVLKNQQNAYLVVAGWPKEHVQYLLDKEGAKMALSAKKPSMKLGVP